ncbi:Type II secretory pathway, prepilin signal peptidase PulO-related peptidase [Thermococcus nautili]|uniref:DUF4129 domain-containing protein n=1 Tax=Thermococcus nautili TaxID=195522 RepID=UPI0025533025|nr:DUF4129 domain-containing protein [Thermococcus nautili]CAI1492628.1 Type II secretory pathway, prepilin signal peptidase PulO-related peptidase [Thermococcus nautili]
MSTKVKFVALLTITVILMSLLMDSYSFSAPHKKNPEAADFLTFVIFFGVFVGLLILVVFALYMRDLPGAGRRWTREKGGSPIAAAIASTVVSILLMLMFGAMSYWSRKSSELTLRCFPNVTNVTNANATNATAANATLFFNASANNASTNVTSNLTNCTVVPDVGPLIGGNSTQATKFLNHPVATHLWLVFLLPILLGLVYLTYYYIKLAREKVERKRKIEKAVEFDKTLDELGLERFSDPREAIVEIYKNAVLWLEGLGIPYRESWTHWEHAEHVEYMHDAFVELTKLFEKAKYAPERLSWSDAERALEVYNKLRGKARELAEVD